MVAAVVEESQPLDCRLVVWLGAVSEKRGREACSARMRANKDGWSNLEKIGSENLESGNALLVAGDLGPRPHCCFVQLLIIMPRSMVG